VQWVNWLFAFLWGVDSSLLILHVSQPGLQLLLPLFPFLNWQELLIARSVTSYKVNGSAVRCAERQLKTSQRAGADTAGLAVQQCAYTVPASNNRIRLTA